MSGRNPKSEEKQNSLFDDSFFEDDEDDDDDFDFDDDEDEEIGETNFGEINESQHHSPGKDVNVSYAEQDLNAMKNSQQSFSSTPMETEGKNLAQEIQFRLGCELGQVLIPYENLQNLNTGSVIDFNNTLQTLYLSVNNVRVGEGMLVDVDGKIGVKITRWYGKL